VTKFNILLTLIVIACALGVVTSQHEARKLFTKLEKEQERARNLSVEWSRLLLEQGAQATRERIERIATKDLLMRVPDGSQIRIISLMEPNNSIDSVDDKKL
jgi:cell division protein FtsL|tara:strand:+ start:524 stop:829 length:306 start_codon:yes stop_codon:yes gene_type:complete